MATGDWNSDGSLDLAVVTRASNSVSILIGNGAGLLTPASNAVVSSRCSAVAAGDINSDGDQDLVVADSTGNAILSFLGDGAGGFAPLPALSTASGPSDLALCDLNQDSKLDLVVACQWSDSIDVRLGVGDGSFGPYVRWAVGQRPHAVEVADINDDGQIDIVVANRGSATLTSILGDGAGGFLAQIESPTVVDPAALALADISGDQIPDAVVAGYDSGTLDRLVSDGAGSFLSTNNYLYVYQPSAILAADLDQDGGTDFAITEESLNAQLHVFYDLDSFSYAEPTRYGTTNAPHTLALGDFDGDGRSDLVVSSGAYFSDATGASIALHLASGSRAYGETLLEGGAGVTGVIVEDLDGDGWKDVAMSVRLRPGKVVVYPGKADRTFGAPSEWYAPSASDLAAADLNGDGLLDLAVSLEFDKAVELLLGAPGGGFTSGGSYPVPGTPLSIAIGDLNGDLKPDIVTSNQGVANAAVLLGDGNGGLGPAASVGPVSYHNYATLADVNGDTNLDIIVGSGVFLGTGSGTFGAKVPFPVSGGDGNAVDLDGDGIKDVAILTPNPTLLKGNGGGTFQLTGTLAAGVSPIRILSADLNGDGTVDLAVCNGYSSTVSVFLGVGHGVFEAKRDFGTWSFPFDIAGGDLDQDGLLDLAVADYNTGSVDILWNRSPGIPTAIQTQLISSEVRPGYLALRWLVEGARQSMCSVYRRTVDTEWVEIGTATSIGASEVLYEDRSPPASGRYGYRLAIQRARGQEHSDEVWVTLNDSNAPLAARLDSPSPNPSRGPTRLTFAIPVSGPASLAIYDALGRRVTTLIARHLSPGWQTVTWNGSNAAGQAAASGIYFARLDTGTARLVRKLVLAR